MLIEGRPTRTRCSAGLLAEGMEPPVALLAYAPDQPELAAFWPFAVFSPEWQAMTWALGAGVAVGLLRPAGRHRAGARATKTLLDRR